MVGIAGIVGCKQPDNGGGNQAVTFTGTITAIEESRIFIKGDSQFNEVYINIVDTTKITLKTGKSGNIIDLKIGDEISVKFSGMVATSQPPQITATDIEVK